MTITAEQITHNLWVDRASQQLWIKTPAGFTMVSVRELQLLPMYQWCVQVMLSYPEFQGMVIGVWEP